MGRYCWMLLCLGAALVGCGSPDLPQPEQNAGRTLEEGFERANQLTASHSQLQIDAYIRRMGLEGLTQDQQGLVYRIEGKPLGPRPVEGVSIALAYSAELLDGTPCGSADTINPAEFVLGHRDQAAGLEEVVRQMAPGQTALAIVPPHMGYGLVGDGKLIPPHAAVVYHIHWMRYTRGDRQ